MKRIVFLSSFILFSLFLFGATAFLYLKYDAESNPTPTDTKTESVPYYTAVPQDKNVLVMLPDKTELLFQLNFADNRLSVIFADGSPRISYCGASPDYTVQTDYTFLADWIDRFGGLTLTVDGTELRYTGVQIVERFSAEPIDRTELEKIVSEHLKQISSYGMTGQDLVFLIERTKTDLTVPDCYDWHSHFPDLCRNVRYFYCDAVLSIEK